MKYKPKTIYCPRCGRRAFVYDGQGTNYLSKKCSKCNKLVVYKPDSDTVELKNVPKRHCSSGMIFY